MASTCAASRKVNVAFHSVSRVVFSRRTCTRPVCVSSLTTNNPVTTRTDLFRRTLEHASVQGFDVGEARRRVDGTIHAYTITTQVQSPEGTFWKNEIFTQTLQQGRRLAVISSRSANFPAHETARVVPERVDGQGQDTPEHGRRTGTDSAQGQICCRPQPVVESGVGDVLVSGHGEVNVGHRRFRVRAGVVQFVEGIVRGEVSYMQRLAVVAARKDGYQVRAGRLRFHQTVSRQLCPRQFHRRLGDSSLLPLQFGVVQSRSLARVLVHALGKQASEWNDRV